MISSTIESVTKRYAEEALAGSRGRIVLTALVGIALYDAALRGEYCSAWLSLLNMSVADYKDLEEITEAIKLKMLITAGAAAAIGIFVHRWLCKTLVGLGLRKESIRLRVESIYRAALDESGSSNAESRIEKALEYSKRYASKVSAVYQCGAVSAALAVVSLFGFFFGGNLVDFVVSIFFALTSLVFASRYGPLFVRYSLPHCVFVDASLGLPMPKIAEASDLAQNVSRPPVGK